MTGPSGVIDRDNVSEEELAFAQDDRAHDTVMDLMNRIDTLKRKLLRAEEQVRKKDLIIDQKDKQIQELNEKIEKFEQERSKKRKPKAEIEKVNKKVVQKLTKNLGPMAADLKDIVKDRM
jgi:predicted RNase H-like nuclease (RuvC/YqgF family)